LASVAADDTAAAAAATATALSRASSAPFSDALLPSHFAGNYMTKINRLLLVISCTCLCHDHWATAAFPAVASSERRRLVAELLLFFRYLFSSFTVCLL